ncbi:MAG: hypothetical protein FWD57_10320, partial [Polyangiaceae bacterium]|nr:hypothetical protein [Polyangiaceae bacterium]
MSGVRKFRYGTGASPSPRCGSLVLSGSVDDMCGDRVGCSVPSTVRGSGLLVRVLGAVAVYALLAAVAGQVGAQAPVPNRPSSHPTSAASASAPDGARQCVVLIEKSHAMSLETNFSSKFMTWIKDATKSCHSPDSVPICMLNTKRTDGEYNNNRLWCYKDSADFRQQGIPDQCKDNQRNDRPEMACTILSCNNAYRGTSCGSLVGDIAAPLALVNSPTWAHTEPIT